MSEDPVLNAIGQLLHHAAQMGTLFVSATSEEGDQAIVLVSLDPTVVKEAKAYIAGDKPPGFGQRELWSSDGETYAKRVDALEVACWHTSPGPEFMVFLPDLRNGDAQRRLPLQAKTFGAALVEADERFPLPAWWADALDALGGGAK